MTTLRYMWVVAGIFAYIGSMAAFCTTSAAPKWAIYDNSDCTGPWLWKLLSYKCDYTGFFYCRTTIPGVVHLYFWMASVSWVSSVAANVVAATVAYSVACRWSSAENSDSVWTSFHRVIRSSLG